jgi:tetratricopeptide (TPR) repeat protein
MNFPMPHSDRDSQSPEYWANLGATFCEMAQYLDAIAACDRALVLAPRYSKAWNNRGNALSALQRNAEAFAAYEQAVRIQPDYHQAWFNRGLLLSEMGAYGNALESYERAIAIYPDPCYLHRKDAIWLQKKLVAV